MDQEPTRILVVDDEVEVRRLIRHILHRKGLVTAEAANGLAALECLRKEPFDLVITDLRMPEMDGLALLEECRRSYADTDVIVLTAFGTIPNAVYAMQRGATDFLTKPFDIGELKQKVEHCIERRRARAQGAPVSPIEPLVMLNRILSTQESLEVAMDEIIGLVQRTFSPISTEVAVLGDNPETDVVVAQRGRLPEEIGYPRLTHQQMQEVAAESNPWLLRERRTPDKDERHAQAGLGITVPLLSGREVVGELTLVRDPSARRYVEADAQLLCLFGSQIGISMLHARTRRRLMDTFHDLKKATLSTVQTLFAAIETYDKYTHDHSERVSRFANLLGERLGLPDEQIDTVRIAGLLHDIGKLGVGDDTLHKMGSLTTDELDRVKLHPVMGARILAGLEAFASVVPIVLHHHERYDGQGYPDRLYGEHIPMGSRIIAVVDTYDSVTSTRPYRPALSVEEAVTILRHGANSLTPC